MSEALVVLSGLLAGSVQWLPCGIGLAAHRHKLGVASVRTTNKWILLGTRPPGSFGIIGRIGFVAIMVIWMCIFFGAMVVPALVGRMLEVPEESSVVLYGIYANFFMAMVAFAIGPALWRRLAL